MDPIDNYLKKIRQKASEPESLFESKKIKIHVFVRMKFKNLGVKVKSFFFKKAFAAKMNFSGIWTFKMWQS